jgi:hypothetical protein
MRPARALFLSINAEKVRPNGEFRPIWPHCRVINLYMKTSFEKLPSDIKVKPDGFFRF